MNGHLKSALRGLISLSLVLAGCTKSGGGCQGPAFDASQLKQLRGGQLYASGGQPSAFLVVPNPIDATRSGGATATSALSGYTKAYDLFSLTTGGRLENGFVHVRIHNTSDDLSTLAQPDQNGQYNFQVSDVHYSEAMAYYQVVDEMGYVEALGFPIVKTRPLYVMVRADTKDNQPNALYDHNYLNPSLPRTIRLFGDTQFAPGEDAEMYRHELGHLVNESTSHEVGIDFAGDNGAYYTEGSALHECMADYLAQSYADKPEIGRWIARNFSKYQPGQPLRSAVDENGTKLMFKDVAYNDGAGNLPERYHTAEWCTRVLWEIRQAFIGNDPDTGAIRADRLMYSAMGLLRKDTSLTSFREALVQADSSLYCGGNEGVIRDTFEQRGFAPSPDTLGQPLDLQGAPVGFDANGNQTQVAPGVEVGFQLRIVNRNSQAARNVRVYLEPLDQGFYPTTYMQAFGDLAAGQSIDIGSNSGIPFDSSVFGNLDQRLTSGSRVRYQLRVVVENGQQTIIQGALSL